MTLPIHQKFLFSCCLAMLCTVFTSITFGFYFSEYEGLNTALLSGSLTPGMSFKSVYFSGNLVISHGYAFFYENFPNIQWISIWEYIWLFIANALAFYSIIVHWKDGALNRKKIGWLLVVFFVVFADHEIHLIYTRVSYLTCGTALLALVVLFGKPNTIRPKLFPFLMLNLFFAIGTFIRNEAALACVLLLFVFSISYLKNISRTLLLFAFPMLLVAGQSFYLAWDIRHATSDMYYKQVEPDIEEQFIARNNMKPLSTMKSHRDSAIYILANDMALSDPSVMNPSFLRSLIQDEGILFTDMRQWHRVLGEFNTLFHQYWYFVLLIIVLGLILYVETAKNSSTRWYWLFFVSSFWGLTIAQTYVDKLNERSWLPYVGLFILCHLLLLLQHNYLFFTKKSKVMLWLCGLLFLTHLYHLREESQRLKKELSIQQSQYNRIKTLGKNKTLVINSSAFNCLFLSHTPFQQFNFSAFSKVYITDSYILPFLPYYKQYLEKECDCNIYAFPSFWKFIQQQQSEVIVVSTPYRMNAIQDYIHSVYAIDLPLHLHYENGKGPEDWSVWTLKP